MARYDTLQMDMLRVEVVKDEGITVVPNEGGKGIQRSAADNCTRIQGHAS